MLAAQQMLWTGGWGGHTGVPLALLLSISGGGAEPAKATEAKRTLGRGERKGHGEGIVMQCLRATKNEGGTSAERNCPPNCLNRYEKWFEKREKGIRKAIRNVPENV